MVEKFTAQKKQVAKTEITKIRLAKSVDSDEVAHYEPPHRQLRCLFAYIFNYFAYIYLTILHIYSTILHIYSTIFFLGFSM